MENPFYASFTGAFLGRPDRNGIRRMPRYDEQMLIPGTSTMKFSSSASRQPGCHTAQIISVARLLGPRVLDLDFDLDVDLDVDMHR
jgi:hypothetical protein